MSNCWSHQDCKFLHCKPIKWMAWIGLQSAQHTLDNKILSAHAHFWILERVCLLGCTFYWNKDNTKSLGVLHYIEIIQKVQIYFSYLVPQFPIYRLLWSSLILFLLAKVPLLLFTNGSLPRLWNHILFQHAFRVLCDSLNV